MQKNIAADVKFNYEAQTSSVINDATDSDVTAWGFAKASLLTSSIMSLQLLISFHVDERIPMPGPEDTDTRVTCEYRPISFRFLPAQKAKFALRHTVIGQIYVR